MSWTNVIQEARIEVNKKPWNIFQCSTVLISNCRNWYTCFSMFNGYFLVCQRKRKKILFRGGLWGQIGLFKCHGENRRKNSVLGPERVPILLFGVNVALVPKKITQIGLYSSEIGVLGLHLLKLRLRTISHLANDFFSAET